ncbi:MAG TPA: phytanoyl-CoA dioxygenase family protein [Dyella sp.]|uniref:phytanoyl-CoA dioxygenase family protein n=1 Tax=Dyella sp. TaxID=1869338 RepID=UPI002B5DCE5B|nr:phytanoyl-CoA dioxygenase family protein [Dyella sp.]HUB88328.1 phytanoyl-CoA dioxygenase family protein [Dyella sp.]
MFVDAYDQLMEHGYAVIPNALDIACCQRALASIEAFKRKHQAMVAPNADEFGHLYRVVNLHLALDSLADAFVESHAALAVADRYFGRSAALYTTLYYERGSEQSLHRDTPYFCTKPSDHYLGMWLALDDVDEGNGPLRVVPGSHQLPPIDVEALARELFPNQESIPKISDKGFAGYQAEVQRLSDAHGLSAREVHVRRGDVILWHPSMFHGGMPHLTKNRPRRSLVMHITPMGVPVYQLDVFFQPSKPVPDRASWRYYRHRDRKIAKFDQIDFGHQYVMPVRRLRWP